MAASRTIRILFTGGGSGGHIYPLVAVADSILKAAAQANIVSELYYVGSVGEFEQVLMRSGMQISNIAAGKVRRYFSVENILDIPKFFIGLLQAFWKLYWIMPDVIFSKGGTGALPVILAGWFYRIPIVIHESDTKPGLNNLLSSWFARRVGVSFESATPYFGASKAFNSGTPIRKEFMEQIPSQESAKGTLKFDPAKPLVVIFGGSQGSQRINEFILTVIPELLPLTQVLHQTGTVNYLEVKKLAETALLDIPAAKAADSRYEAVSYFDTNMKTALAAADIIVSRAGSNSIFEIAAFGKPAILIPLPESAGDHQRENAYAFTEKGGGVVIEESNLLPGIFTHQVREILSKPEVSAAMQKASSAFFKPDAADIVALEILKIA